MHIFLNITVKIPFFPCAMGEDLILIINLLCKYVWSKCFWVWTGADTPCWTR